LEHFWNKVPLLAHFAINLSGGVVIPVSAEDFHFDHDELRGPAVAPLSGATPVPVLRFGKFNGVVLEGFCTANGVASP
jgi:hypothetical protein